jgi:hypothetical protein
MKANGRCGRVNQATLKCFAHVATAHIEPYETVALDSVLCDVLTCWNMHGLIPEMVYQSGNFKSAVFSVFFVLQSMPLHNTSRQIDLACGNNNKGWVWNIPGLLRLEQRWKKERACFARVNGSPFPLRSLHRLLLLVGTCLCWWVSADVGRLRGEGSTKADRSYSGVAGWRWV